MSEEVSNALLEKGAVKLNAKDPFTFVSGIRSPIYCDNRLMISFPEQRGMIVDEFVKKLEGLDYDIVAGTSTAGIPWAAWISEKTRKPMAYIREKKKEHGAGNQIEGASVNGKKVVVIEDLISTGGSSYRAVQAAKDAGSDVVALIAIFTYEFEKAKERFKDMDARTLSDFTTLVRVAKNKGYLTEDEVKMVLEWNKNPSGWGPSHGFPNKE